MNIVCSIQDRVRALLEAEIASCGLPGDLDLQRLVVEPPREAAPGDLSTHAAMVYAKEAKAAGSNSRALAQKLVVGLKRESDSRAPRSPAPAAMSRFAMAKQHSPKS
jgi:arginyl-tRNA synthetase